MGKKVLFLGGRFTDKRELNLCPFGLKKDWLLPTKRGIVVAWHNDTRKPTYGNAKTAKDK
jgi:hypothetical protein